jgi:hypothetical protein
MPSASATEAIVFAVYMPPHEPSPGANAHSMRFASSSLISPALTAPTAAKESMIVMSCSLPSDSFTQPGAIEPE